MKKIVFFILLIFPFLIKTQIINFPDANFKAKLLQSSPSSIIAQTGWFGTYAGQQIKIDSNSDGEIDQNEALQVTQLIINGSSISNVTGLEYFANLRVLLISNNSVSSFYFPSLVYLYTLYIGNNQLTSLDVSNYLDLTYLICQNNQITSFDCSMLPNLKNVYCGHNLISSLDFTNNPLFEDLGCEYNPNLTSIKIKNNHTQLFGSQTQLQQCWGGNPNLNYICADASEIPALQSFLASCNITQTITIDSACALGVDGFNEREVSVFPNPSNDVVYLDNTNNYFKSVQVYNSIGQLISTQKIGVAASASIDLSGYSKGVYLLNFQGEKGSKCCKVVKE